LPEKEFEKRKTDQPAKQITLECIFCDTPLYFNEQHGFYKCPDCGGEWWPGQRTPSTGLLHFGVTSRRTNGALASVAAAAGVRERKDRKI